MRLQDVSDGKYTIFYVIDLYATKSDEQKTDTLPAMSVKI